MTAALTIGALVAAGAVIFAVWSVVAAVRTYARSDVDRGRP